MTEAKVPGLNPFESVQKQLDKAAKLLKLDNATHQFLRWPQARDSSRVFRSNCTSPKDPKHQPVKSTPRPGTKSGREEDELNKYKGLRRNCANRKVCTFRKPEGGVWHCKEYC